MNVLEILIISTSLSMDSFAVSMGNGLKFPNLNLKKTLIISTSFAVFQSVFLIIGWFVGVGINSKMKSLNYLMAFIILTLIGFKMIFDSFKKQEKEKNIKMKTIVILSQAFATSIDAFAVGVGFKFLNASLLIGFIILGITTFVFSNIGLIFGKYFGKKTGKISEIFGGLVLIGIGIKVLVIG